MTGIGSGRLRLSRWIGGLLFIIASLLFALATTRPTQGISFPILIATAGVVLGLAAQTWLDVTSVVNDLVDQERSLLDEQIKMKILGNTAWEAGIREMAQSWDDLVSAVSTVSRLAIVDEAPRVWYFLTLNPVPFVSQGWFHTAIVPALRRGVKVRWAYLAHDASDSTKGTFLDTQHVHPSVDRAQRLESAAAGLSVNVAKLMNSVQTSIVNLGAEGVTLAEDSLEIYESDVMHPFLAFFSLVPSSSPIRGRGVVHPYQMYNGASAPSSSTPSSRWGMYLESPGFIFEQHAQSALDHFTIGIARGYIRKTWSSATVTTLPASG